MNNDPSSSSGPPAGGRAARSGSPSPSQRHDAQPTRPSSSRGERRRRRKGRKRRSPGLRKKLEFVTHLLKGLDSLVFAELSALYYMEYARPRPGLPPLTLTLPLTRENPRCSMFRLIIRAMSQLMYLSPKAETFPFLMPASRIHVVLVVVPNLWCILSHLLFALPQGRDYHRGYLHGSIIIDFIGQKPPTHRVFYILADIFLLFLQCLMLAIHTEREKLRLSLRTFRPLVADAALEAATSRTLEDLDAEERGVGGPGSPHPELDEQEDGMELQSLTRSSSSNDRTDGAALETTARPDLGDDTSRSRLSDILTSGNAILGEYHIIHCMRVAATELERTTAQSLQSIGYRATLAALNARRQGATAQRPQEQAGGDV